MKNRQILSALKRMLPYVGPQKSLVLGSWLMMIGVSACMAGVMVLSKPILNLATGSEGAGVRTLLNLRDALTWLHARGLDAYAWAQSLTGLDFRYQEHDYYMAMLSDFAGQFQMLKILGLIAAVLSLFLFVFQFCAYLWSHRAVFVTSRSLAQKVHDHILEVPVGHHDTRQSGELVSRVSNDLACSQGLLIFAINEAPRLLIKLLIGLTALFAVSFELTVVVLICALVFFAPLKSIGSKIRRSSRHSLEAMARLTESMSQSFRGIRVVKSFSLEKQRAQDFAKHNQVLLRSLLAIVKARGLSRAFLESSYHILYAALMVGAGYGILKGSLMVGEISAFAALFATMIYQPARGITKAYNNLQQSVPGAESVFDLLDEDNPLKDHPQAKALPGIHTGLRFEEVSYRYDGTQEVLRDISLDVPAGQVVAVVGPSGAGKSTLMDLLTRLRDPVSSRLLVDDHHLKDIRLEDWRRLVSVVDQQPFLFDGSIAENIALGRPGASVDQVKQAAQDAGLLNDSQDLPQGLETPVGEGGKALSGGQMQRVSIARALLRDPQLLILDEPTAALDTATEAKIQEAFERLMQGRTTFIVAHRLSTIKRADRIVVLQDGSIVQDGTHQELMQAEGLYRDLWHAAH